jgi:hypothetical protein
MRLLAITCGQQDQGMNSDSAKRDRVYACGKTAGEPQSTEYRGPFIVSSHFLHDLLVVFMRRWW